MASRAAVDAYRNANATLVARAERDLASFFASLDLTRPEAARDALMRFVPHLVDTYGEVAAAAAAEWYDELRADAHAVGRYRATMAPVTDHVPVQETTRRLAGSLWTDSPAGMLPGLVDKLSIYVLTPGRDTIIRATGSDPAHPRWARVPGSDDPCKWCRMLASRGFVYHSEATAGGLNKWHGGNCKCEPVPDWSEDPRLDGYDPSALYAEYRAPK